MSPISYDHHGNQYWNVNSNKEDKVSLGKCNESERELHTIKATARIIKAQEEGRVPEGTVEVCLKLNSEKLGIEADDLLRMAIPYTIDDDNSETSQIS